MDRTKFTTMMNPELIEKLKIQAVKEKCSVADILEQLVTKYLETIEAHES